MDTILQRKARQAVLKETRLLAPYQRRELSFGRYTYGEPAIEYISGGSLSVGHYCSIGNRSSFWLGGNHRTDWVTTYPFPSIADAHFPGAPDEPYPLSKGHISVGSDVWIGSDSAIMSGVTIGDGAVIGAYAVVASDVPPYAVVVGNPGRVIRYRFREDQIEALLRIRWWDWDDADVAEHVAMLCQTNIDWFIDRFDTPENNRML